MSFPLVALKDCCTVVGGATPKRNVPEYWDIDVPWVTPKDISTLDGPYLNDAPEYISNAGFEKCATSLLPTNSILLTSRAPIGNVAIAGREMCTNQGFKSLVPGDKVDHLYLYYCIKHLSPKLQALGNGATFKEVNKKIVESFKIPLPPLEEQKRIAAILDKADALRCKRQQAIELADQFLRSVFLDMFGDPVTNPKGWKICKLNELCDLRNGYAFKSSDYVESSTTLNCRMSSIRPSGNFDVSHNMKYLPDKFYDQHSEYRLFDGDVVIAMTDLATEAKILGVPTIVQSKGFKLLQNQRVGKLTLLDEKQLGVAFLQATLNWKSVRQYFQKFAGGGLQINLGKPDLLSIEIMIPPMHLQKEFENIVNTVSALIEKLTKDNHIQNALFNSLSQQAFKGELTQSKVA